MILFSAILAFSAASYGRIVEWWDGLEIEAQIGYWLISWSLLILIAYQQGGTVYGFIAGIGIGFLLLARGLINMI